jgi:hypothetical protein
LILTSHQIGQMYLSKLYRSILQGVGDGDTTTSSGMLTDLAIIAAAAVCSTIEWIPAQLWQSKSRGASGSHQNQDLAWINCIQCCPNSWSSSSRPPSSLATSVLYTFPRVGTVEYSQKLTTKGYFSKVAGCTISIPMKVAKDQFQQRGKGFRPDSTSWFRWYSWSLTHTFEYGNWHGYWGISNFVSHGNSSTTSFQMFIQQFSGLFKPRGNKTKFNTILIPWWAM